jgi:hypothetical protein
MRFTTTFAGCCAAALALAPALTVDAAPAATQKAISGIITAVDPALLTIAPMQGHKQCVTGRIDPARTHVFIDGHAARLADLKVTYAARAELALDDVWTTVRIDTSH